MARMNSAKYGEDIVDAFEVDDQYDSFNRRDFKCLHCSIQIQYSRGIDEQDPHFKNWPNVQHLASCLAHDLLKQLEGRNDRSRLEALVCTILPRAQRLRLPEDERERIVRISRLYGKRSRKFLAALSTLNNNDLNELKLLAEDGQYYRIRDLIMTQDEIIEQLNAEDGPFICILKGVTSKIQAIGNNINILMTTNGKYKNTQAFSLFIPASYTERNHDQIAELEQSLIYCYGVPVQNQYGYKMDLYSITHQVVILRRF